MPPIWTSSERSSRRFARAGEVILVFLIAVAARVPFLDHIPHKDELNHFLAARAYLATGTFEILPGASEYERAWMFTSVIATMFRIFGESLVAARLPAVFAGAALVALLFWWVRTEVGRPGAWFAALGLAFMPISIQLSQWIRFYTPHALLYLGACVLVYRVLCSPAANWRSASLHAVAAAVLLGLAIHLQLTTFLGMAGLAVWVVLMVLYSLLRRFRKGRERLWIAAGLIGVAGALVVTLGLFGVVDRLIALANHADLWAEYHRENTRFYHELLLFQFPTLWTLFPVAAVIALVARPRAALLALCVFGVALISLSVVAQKSERYLFFALPMFFAIWGIAVGAILPWLFQWSRSLLTDTPVGRLHPRAPDIVFAAALGMAALFTAATNPAVSYGQKMLTVGDYEWQWGRYRGEPDWESAGALLAERLERTDVVLASYDISAVYGLGRLDYLLRRVQQGGIELEDFQVRGKTPASVITTPAGLALVIECTRSGLAIIEQQHWRRSAYVTTELADELEAGSEQIPLPEELRLLAFGWDGNRPPESDTRCEAVPVR